MNSNQTVSDMEQREDGTVFLPLPYAMRKPITGGCQCDYCKAHPHNVPCWDTVAWNPRQVTSSWSVHYPELPAILAKKL